MVEHLHTTREDICRQDLALAAIMGFPDDRQGRNLGTGLAFDVALACGLHALGWVLVTTEDLYMVLDKLLGRSYANLHLAILNAGNMWPFCW